MTAAPHLHPLLAAAHAWHDAGCSVIPVLLDGTKRPATPWKPHTTTRATPQQLTTWFNTGQHGVGVVCGAISHNLEMLELEGRAANQHEFTAIDTLALAHGLTALWRRLLNGYKEVSPSGGLHLLYRVDGKPVPGNTRLARTPTGDVLVETRGEGGYVIVAPTPGAGHTTGRPWQSVASEPADITTITADEHEALHALFRDYDKTPTPTANHTPNTPQTHANHTGDRPGDHYNNTATWHNILTPHGWTQVTPHGWRRPGKTIGISATTGRNDADNLYVFSSSTPFDVEKPYSKFAAYTLLEHGGDYTAAARALAAQGHGTPTPRRDRVDLAALIHQSTPPAAATATPAGGAKRQLRVTKASDIAIRPVHWLWDERVAIGTLALVGGREGAGKSTLVYTLIAQVTTGQLPGRYHDTPKAVIVCASEDSWAHTIVPRLMGAGADLDRVYRVDVTTSEGYGAELSLPRDIPDLEALIAETDTALLVLDPLMSRLDAALDTHKDAEVRIALEPVVALADRAKAAVIGLIHVNKGTSSDPLTLLMGSRAFAAVARSVIFIMRDPDDESIRLLGQAKNNLGKTDLDTLAFTIESHKVAETDEGEVWTGRVKWLGTADRSIADAIAGDSAEDIDGAAMWLRDYLTSNGGSAPSSDAKTAGKKAGFSESTIKRARARSGVRYESRGLPRRTYWSIEEVPVGSPPVGSPVGSRLGESEPTDPTDPTEGYPQADGIFPASRASRASRAIPPARAAQLDDPWAAT